MMRKYLTITAICALALPVPTPAQDYGLGGMDAYISASNSNMIMTNTIISNAAFRASLKKKLRSKSAKVAAPSRQSNKSTSNDTKADYIAPAASLNFKTSPTIRKRSIDQFLASMQNADPTGARALQERHSKTDFFASLGTELGQYNMRTDNIGDAMTVWLINVWMGANGISDDPHATQIQAVRLQVAESLRSSETITKASDAQKQELAERLWLNASVVGSMITDPRVKSGEMRGVLKTAMSQIGRNMGMDLTAMQISNTGFSS